MAESTRRLDDETSAEDESAAGSQFARDDLKKAESLSVGSDRVSENSTSPGKVNYSSGDDSKYSPDPLSTSTSPSGKVSYDTSDEVPEAEQSLYNSTSTKPTSRLRYLNFLGTRRRKAIFGGGLIGTIVGLVFFLSFLSGPLEIIHFGQLLTQFHFSSQESASDNRLLKMGRFIRYAGRGELQYTRVGVFQAKYAKSIEADLNKSGIESAYSQKFKFFDGFVVDPEQLAGTSLNELQGKSTEEIKAVLQEKFPDATIETHPSDPGKLFINAKNLGYRKSLGLTTFMLEASGKNKLAAAIEARVMGGIYDLSWHPFSKFKTKLGRSLDTETAFRQNEAEEVEKGASQAEITTATETDPKDKAAGTNAQTIEQEANSTAGDGAAAGEAAGNGDPKAISGFQDSIHIKLAGGFAGAAGVLCILKGLGDKADEIKQEQVVLPLARMAWLVVAGGNQGQSGQDIDLTQVGYLSSQFSGVDSTGHKSSWFDAQSIQAELGHPNTGVAPDATLDSVGKNGNPFSFLATGTIGSILGPVCSTVGQGVLAVLTFFGASVADLTQQVVLAAIGPSLENTIAHWIAGKAVDPLSVFGADFGNYVNYGARIAANGAAITNGGSALSTQQADNLKGIQDVASQQQFNSTSLAHRLFSPYDERSAISKIIDKTSSSPAQNFASLGHSLLGIGQGFKAVSSLFAPKAQAAGTGWNYGFPAYGFSESELDNPAVENPYQNAEDAVDLLSSSAGPGYIDKAEKCFGVKIAKGTDGVWTANNDSIPAYNKIPDGCNDPDTNWLKIRFFIFDTKTADAMGCYYGDETACDDVGFGSSPVSTDTTTTSTPGTPTDTSALFSSSVSIPCATGTKDLGIQDGYHDGQLVKIRVCAVSDLNSSGQESTPGSAYYITGANGKAVVNSIVSGSVYSMAQAASKAGVTLSANSAFRTMAHQQSLCPCDGVTVAVPGYSNHQMGLAIDFATLPSTPGPVLGNPVWDWLSINAINFGYKNYPREAWHWSPTGN